MENVENSISTLYHLSFSGAIFVELYVEELRNVYGKGVENPTFNRLIFHISCGVFHFYSHNPCGFVHFGIARSLLRLQLIDKLVDLDLQLCIALYLGLDGAEGVHDGGVVLCKQLTDLLVGHIGELAEQIHADVARLADIAGSLLAVYVLLGDAVFLRDL